MGQSADQTVREIEQARERLDADLRQLEARLPFAPVRGAAVAAGAATALWLAARGTRRLRSARRWGRGPVAVVLPGTLARRVAVTVQEGRWKGWAAGAAGLWLALRVAEIWQLRRLGRALEEARWHS